jgi:hypothetical protein
MKISAVRNSTLKQYTVVSNSNNKSGIKEINSSLRQISKILDYTLDNFITHSFVQNKEIYYFPNQDIEGVYFSAKNNLDLVLDKVFCKRLFFNDEFLDQSTELLLKCRESIEMMGNVSDDNIYKNDNCFKEMVLESYQRFFDKLSPQEQDDFCDAFYERSMLIYRFFFLRKRSPELNLINQPLYRDPWGTGRFNP